jgi:hypothetical protein
MYQETTRQADNETRPAHPHMHPKAVEDLPEKRVLAEGDLGVGELWSGTMVAQRSPLFEVVIYQAENGDDKGATFSVRRPAIWLGCERPYSTVARFGKSVYAATSPPLSAGPIVHAGFAS